MPKKILMMHSGNDLYGSGKIFLNTIDVLRQDYDMLVLLETEGVLYQSIKERGIPVQLQNLAVLRRADMKGIGLIKLGIKFIQALFSLVRLAKKQRVDLLYSNTLALIVGPFVAKLIRLKHIYHIHEIMERPVPFRRFMSFLINRMSSRSIAVSDAVKNFWLSKPTLANKIERIYNAVDWDANSIQKLPPLPTAALRKKEDDVIITMVGRINLIKGQHYFLDIIEQYLIRYGNGRPSIKALMVGDAFQGYEYLEDAVNQRILAINGPVYNVGFRTDIQAIMQLSDILIMPSTQPDSLPTVILEAMACGLPVICTTTGGSIEMVENGVNGFHIPLNNPGFAAEQLNLLVTDNAKRKEMGQRSLEIIKQKFSSSTFDKKIKSFFREQLD